MKIGDRVKIKHEDIDGIIDAITGNKVRLRTNHGYRWVYEFEIEQAEKKPEVKRGPNIKYLG